VENSRRTDEMPNPSFGIPVPRHANARYWQGDRLLRVADSTDDGSDRGAQWLVGGATRRSNGGANVSFPQIDSQLSETSTGGSGSIPACRLKPPRRTRYKAIPSLMTINARPRIARALAPYRLVRASRSSAFTRKGSLHLTDGCVRCLGGGDDVRRPSYSHFGTCPAYLGRDSG